MMTVRGRTGRLISELRAVRLHVYPKSQGETSLRNLCAAGHITSIK